MCRACVRVCWLQQGVDRDLAPSDPLALGAGLSRMEGPVTFQVVVCLLRCPQSFTPPLACLHGPASEDPLPVCRRLFQSC